MIAIPPVKVTLGDLGAKLRGSGPEVTVPREILSALLDLYISCWDFDEEWYLATYPDVQDAIKQGLFASGWAHFKAVGYFESRLGSRQVVDTEWYMNTYPDIAQAILDGKITSAQEHYDTHGYVEGRLPRDPGVHPKWYAPRYLASSRGADQSACTDHFIRRGYRQLAVPAPPR